MTTVRVASMASACALTFVVAGCASQKAPSVAQPPPPAAAPSATPVTSASPSSPPVAVEPAADTAAKADPLVLGVDGIGPYRIGVRVDEMPAGLFGKATPVDPVNCPGLYTEQATGQYEGTLVLTVRENYLVAIGTAGGKPVHTREGVTIGTPFAQLQNLYRGGSTHQSPTGEPGFIVTTGNRVLLMRGNPIRDGVGWIEAGEADHTRNTFLTGRCS
jgi:hypothetical protein